VPVVATAGHVDHGKSTLVLALTGTDPDRWAEEKARGLTIDLGFAATDLGPGRLELVDVPGHVRFLPNMLAGVGAVDACLFVVAATEGWKPQTEEHLRILELLGVGRGVVALTKVGLVDEDEQQLARWEVEERLAGSPLAGAPVVAVDAVAGIGLDDLRAALAALLAELPEPADRKRARLWVDRSFAARGSGTVVTGTLAGGSLAVGDEVELRPSGRRARVRALQTHGSSIEHVGPGHRVAVNLVGVSHQDVRRGEALVHPGRWVATSRFDGSLGVLAALDHDVSRRGAHILHVGTAAVPCRLRVLGPDKLAPGEAGLVRIHLPTQLPLQPGDRFVVREHGRGETVGGGEVLDVDPVLRVSKARPDRSVDRVVAERGWVTVDMLERLTGEPATPTIGRWVASPEALAATVAVVAGAVEAAGPLGLDAAALDKKQRLVAEAGLVEGVALIDGRWRLAAAATDPLVDHPWLAAVRAEPFSPPPPDGVDRTELRELARRGHVVERDGVWFATEAVDQAAAAAAALLLQHPDGVTLSQLREVWATTRKWAVPLASLLDASGTTRRRGDLRVAGPRLPTNSGPGEG
jgi:selenocysteine-specific elongation factor